MHNICIQLYVTCYKHVLLWLFCLGVLLNIVLNRLLQRLGEVALTQPIFDIYNMPKFLEELIVYSCIDEGHENIDSKS